VIWVVAAEFTEATFPFLDAVGVVSPGASHFFGQDGFNLGASVFRFEGAFCPLGGDDFWDVLVAGNGIDLFGGQAAEGNTVR
jgi:hypothetical protein